MNERQRGNKVRNKIQRVVCFCWIVLHPSNSVAFVFKMEAYRVFLDVLRRDERSITKKEAHRPNIVTTSIFRLKENSWNKIFQRKVEMLGRWQKIITSVIINNVTCGCSSVSRLLSESKTSTSFLIVCLHVALVCFESFALKYKRWFRIDVDIDFDVLCIKNFFLIDYSKISYELCWYFEIQLKHQLREMFVWNQLVSKMSSEHLRNLTIFITAYFSGNFVQNIYEQFRDD